MHYRQIVKHVQLYSGFSDQESEMALRTFVEKLATRLTEEEREDFAAQLPTDLKEVVLSVNETHKWNVNDFIHEVCEAEDIEENRAKKQIYAAWQAIKDALSPGEVKDIQAQLPNDMVAMLH
jgi:uncharacterized protein (DUF2267 family)